MLLKDPTHLYSQLSFSEIASIRASKPISKMCYGQTERQTDRPIRLFLEATFRCLKIILGSAHIAEQLLFSMFPSILTFDFELIFGLFLTFFRALVLRS